MTRLAGLAVCVAASACGFQLSGAPGIDARDPDAPLVEIDAAIDSPGTACADSWVGTGWSTRRKLTINGAKVTGTVSLFPVLVDVVVPGAQFTGNDFVFTAANGMTRLPHEVERYDAGSGRLIAWVQVPAVTAQTDTILYLYSGNPSASVNANITLVWAPDFTAVWHLGETTSGTAPQMMDSALAQKTGASRGGLSSATGMNGKIGGAIQLDGTNDGLDVGTLALGTMFTYEAWINPTTIASWHAIMNNAPAYNRWFGVFNMDLDFYDMQSEITRPSMLTTGAWHHVMTSYDGSELRIYRNGAQMGQPQAVTYAPVTSGFQIGYTTPSVGEWFGGRIDEVRVSRIARSASYAATTYANQNDPGSFTTVAMSETCP